MEKLKDCCWSIMAFVAVSVSILTIRLLYVLSLNGILTASLYARCFRFRFAPRFYIALATDDMSLQKARVFEDSLVHKNGVKGPSAQFMQIYRSREVGQSYITSVWTTFLAIVHALWLMIRTRPQVLLALTSSLLHSFVVIAILPQHILKSNHLLSSSSLSRFFAMDLGLVFLYA